MSGFDNETKNKKAWWKVAVIVGAVFGCACIICVIHWVKKPQPYEEIAILSDNNEVIYPTNTDILNEAVVDKSTFFTYKTSETIGDSIITYPALYKWEKGHPAERISDGACPHFEVADNRVIYLDSTMGDFSHGQLCMIELDGLNKSILEKEVGDFSIDKEYIYFTYCFDTVGAGLSGHALYRMDLNGDNIVAVSYELSGPDLMGGHNGVYIEDGWAMYDNYKIELGNPADGLEKVVLLEDTDAEWIYYTTNRLIKAKPDGSEQVVLDDIDDFWYSINKIENGWIYYQKGNDLYKIDIDGNHKEKIEKL